MAMKKRSGRIGDLTEYDEYTLGKGIVFTSLHKQGQVSLRGVRFPQIDNPAGHHQVMIAMGAKFTKLVANTSDGQFVTVYDQSDKSVTINALYANRARTENFSTSLEYSPVLQNDKTTQLKIVDSRDGLTQTTVQSEKPYFHYEARNGVDIKVDKGQNDSNAAFELIKLCDNTHFMLKVGSDHTLTFAMFDTSEDISCITVKPGVNAKPRRNKKLGQQIKNLIR